MGGGQQNLVCEPQKKFFLEAKLSEKTDVVWPVGFVMPKAPEICVKSREGGSG